jgi:TfoX/Sxy family transcriptional regulator of competence genes
VAYSEALAAHIRDMLDPGGGVQERKMFGGIAFMVRGHMCCGVMRDQLMLRLGPDEAPRALDQPHARPMDFTGRPMKGFVLVDPQGLTTDAELRSWLDKAQDFVSTLPPK